METGVPLTSEFRRKAYSCVAEYIDAANVFLRLGESAGTRAFYEFRDMPPRSAWRTSSLSFTGLFLSSRGSPARLRLRQHRNDTGP